MVIFSTIASWRRASKHYKRNTTNSPLYALPYELVERIGSHLDHVDRVCFALSSIKYLEVTQPLHPRTAPDPQHRRAIQRRLWRDDFYRWRRFNVMLCVTWCVGCAEWHPDYLFPKHTRKLKRKDRWCRKAIDGPLVACQHYAFHFKDIVKLATKKKEKRTFGLRHPGFWFWFCRQCDNPVMQKEIRFQDPPTLGVDLVTGAFRLSYTLRLFAVEWNRPVAILEIVGAMRTAKLSICPHMATDDEAIIRRVVRGSVSEGINVSCGVCETECRVLEGYRKFGGADVVMNIVRNLGKLEKESDPIWRAQLQGRYVVDG
jgi:hypothetical protein